jgi:hypothetical protein
MRKKVNKQPITKQTERIHSLRSIPDNLIRFSFRHFDQNEKFGAHLAGDGYIGALMERLRDVSGLTLSEFRSNKNKSLRAHTHDWSRTTEENGYTHLNEQLRQCEPWQFQLSANEHGRIHGILIDEVFYVIWIDPMHKLYL